VRNSDFVSNSGRAIYMVLMLTLGAFYLATAFWVISDYRFDQLAKVSFRWPYHILFFSYIASAFAIILMASAVASWLWPVRAISVGFLAISVLASVECVETVIVFWNAGAIGIGEYGKHLLGPVLFVIAWGAAKFRTYMSRR
jgi:hypothetical protein